MAAVACSRLLASRPSLLPCISAPSPTLPQRACPPCPHRCSFSQLVLLAAFRDIFIMSRPGWRRHYIPPLVCVALLVLLPGGSADEPLPDQLAADGLGPLLVNKDGSLQRISNWSELTKQEREAAVRAALRRNTKRLEELTRLEELRKADKRDGKSMAGGLGQWIQRSRQRAAKLWRRVISWFRSQIKKQSASTSADSSPTTHAAQQTAEEAERVLPPIDFAPEYVSPILSGVKVIQRLPCTTRACVAAGWTWRKMRRGAMTLTQALTKALTKALTEALTDTDGPHR